MEWKAESGREIDESLKDEVLQKIEEGTLTMDDVRDFFTVFVQVAGNTEDIREEMEDFACNFQIEVNGEPACWLSVCQGSFEAGSGPHPNPDVVLNMEEETALGIFSGRVDPTAAYMCGDLEVEGIISDAIRLKDLLEMVQDELD